MGSALELGKLVTASWLYHNWNSAPRMLRYYLTVVVVVLMCISSMGIFGFLSKAHIDQTLNINTGQADQIQIINSKVEFEKQSMADLDKQVQQIDAAISKMTDRGQAQNSLKAADQQRKNRDALVKRKEEHVQSISALTQQRIQLESSVKKLEAEVGPLKYIADMVYGKADGDQLEKAVRYVILLIVLVFDPLAVVLLIAANTGLKNRKRVFTKDNISSILEIDDTKLFSKSKDKKNKDIIWAHSEKNSSKIRRLI